VTGYRKNKCSSKLVAKISTKITISGQLTVYWSNDKRVGLSSQQHSSLYITH